jgi:hypothetical protein
LSDTEPKHSPAKYIRSILRGRADATTMRGAGIVLAASAIVAMGGALGMWLGDGDGPAQDGNNATPAAPPAAAADASWLPATEFSPPAVASPLPVREPRSGSVISSAAPDTRPEFPFAHAAGSPLRPTLVMQVHR